MGSGISRELKALANHQTTQQPVTQKASKLVGWLGG
ncbi:hypothetical protein BpOF4_06610 [Alkalihalophilus pseudofirmus OF4]|uniref:Uncharacterized protein n=1 Tax=Alkalihalophilus pseudofirmus (strain ATCC BAA-2126 / JCM 17055 / OF4) TaxID=398511 RepID=D3G0A5_ALKPO|nr:hypothetical protein BpOF4_06610 [Alkalihalophilus pseudofirmus OF4]